jgi:cyanophycin synthetase
MSDAVGGATGHGERPAGPRAAGGGARSPLPIVVITGTVGKTTTGAMLDRLIQATGWRTVTWFDQGVTIDRALQEGELGPWGEGLRQVMQRRLDLAIQTLPAATVQAVGLAAGAYRLGIITNLAMNDAVYADTWAARAQHQANRVVAAAVHPRGTLVLNADDRAVVDLAAETRGRVVPWALRRRSPALARHLGRGGGGMYVADDHLIWEQAGEIVQLAPVAAIPATHGGHALFQVQNVLAATAAALALGRPREAVAAALADLRGGPELSERVLTLENGAHCRVLAARATTLPALDEVARLVRRRLPGRARAIGAAWWPDGGGAALAREQARRLARLYATLYLFGPGCEVGADLVRDARLPRELPTVCVAVADETEAIERLAQVVASGDFVLLLGASAPATMALLDSYREGL